MARTQAPFVEELPRVLRARGMSIRGLAREVGVSDSHLSKILRGTYYKTVSPDLASRVALALGLEEDHFPETREGYVVAAVRGDPTLRDRLYDQLRRAKRPRSRR
jgi:transcriptional regulator with XRE-family HTH domain